VFVVGITLILALFFLAAGRIAGQL